MVALAEAAVALGVAVATAVRVAGAVLAPVALVAVPVLAAVDPAVAVLVAAATDVFVAVEATVLVAGMDVDVAVAVCAALSAAPNANHVAIATSPAPRSVRRVPRRLRDDVPLPVATGPPLRQFVALVVPITDRADFRAL